MKRAIIAAFLVILAWMSNPVFLPAQGEEPSDAYSRSRMESVGQADDQALPGSSGTESRGVAPLDCVYYDKTDFYHSIRGYEASPADGKGIILGGIVTHHLLASRLMAQFFNTVAAAGPETVVVIGPNHKRYGTSLIHTGTWSWETAFGSVRVDRGIENGIVKEFGAHEDYDLLTREHSISALVPYIGYYLPGAEIVPVLINGNLGMDGCVKMTDFLEAVFREKKCLLVSSIDFSHYLTPEKAGEMDSITMEAIERRDYDKIMSMGNDYLDAPPILVTTLMLMDRLGADENLLLEHKNSSDITGVWADSTTSYLTYQFKRTDAGTRP